MFVEGLKKYAETDKIAVDIGGETHSYKELLVRSKALACYIKDKFSSNKPVAIYGDRQFDMVTSAYAAVMAKKTFVMLADAYPIERLKFILNDCDADLIINVSEKDFTEINLNKINVFDIDSYVDKYVDAPELDTDNYNMEDNAFIVYTSGSTGNPKGVQITYNNLNYYCTEANMFYQMSQFLGEGVKSISMSSYAFIINMLFFRIIETGGTWFVVPTNMLRNTESLFNYMKQVQPHLLAITPSIANKLLDNPDFNRGTFNRVFNVGNGGEPLTIELAKRLDERFPHIINNAYGATETCSININYCFNLENLSEDDIYVPVGDRKTSLCFMIVDKDNKVIEEDNVVGEATFFSKGITKGYVNLPELTKQHYIEIDGKRCFKTGDLAYYKNGLIYLQGRSDNQIKIGGNRVEVEDVEAHLTKCEEVKESAVGVNVDENNVTSLTAIIVLKDEYKQEKHSTLFLNIKKQMARMVESFKIPQRILFVDGLPRNFSGKIDRVGVKETISKAN